MEEVAASLVEKTVVGGAFIYLLYYVIQNMKAITNMMGGFGDTLKEVSNTLLKIDMRVELLERRIDTLEEK